MFDRQILSCEKSAMTNGFDRMIWWRYRPSVFGPVLVVMMLGQTHVGFAADLQQLKTDYDQKIQPLLKTYCHECHNSDKMEGELNLKRFRSASRAVDTPAHGLWEAVAKRLQAKEMPPEGSRQPTDAERQALQSWIMSLPKGDGNCDKLATDETQHFYQGYVMSRRLNRAEYQNSVRDLFGLDVRVADRLPSDGSGGEGFDTCGDSLFTSPILLEAYLDVAHAVTGILFRDPAVPRPAWIDEKAVEAARSRLLLAAPEGNVAPREAARRVLQPLLRRAYRRPVDDADMTGLLSLVDKSLTRGDSFDAALRLAFKGVLLSPNFLFLVEPEPEKEGVYPLGPFPLASRLSYFLWSSAPDDELLAKAESGKLTDPAVLSEQVRRMLRDPKARALGEQFGKQWLEIGGLGTQYRPDRGQFPDFDDSLAQAMTDETTLFIQSIFAEDRSLLELLDAPYTFLNERLAKHYGVPGVSGPQMRQVTLADGRRGGVATHASVLTVTSYPRRTSPVLRGKWVLEQLLGAKVPPPPPGVTELPKEAGESSPLTLRQQLEKHRSKAECAACHARMDPLGFGLENFDGIGRWRDQEGGKPLDTTGTLPGGRVFHGPVELKKVLAERKQEFLRHLARKMYGYAVGRSVNRFDQCVIDAVVKKVQEDGDHAQTLVEGIVLSYPFRHRYAKK